MVRSRKAKQRPETAGLQMFGASSRAKKENRMSSTISSPRGGTRSARLFMLELSSNSVYAMNPDGSDRKTIVTDCHLPDGIAVDAEAGHIYWTNMGVPNLNDGSIEGTDV